MITFNRINGFFNQLTELPNQNAFSPAGGAALAEWGERQPWWGRFAVHHRLGGDWLSTPMGDSHLFVLNLYRFLNSPVPYREGKDCAIPNREPSACRIETEDRSGCQIIECR